MTTTATQAALAESRALTHCAYMQPGDRVSFLRQYARARDAWTCGADVDGLWRRLLASDAPASAVAGWIEGLASTRAVPNGERR